MPELSTEVRIFLSSTFVDLKDLRQETAERLRQVFGARLIVMETFGSDEAPPVISSVRKVRECDVFVGIYARRYGTIDPGTGKSITELELDEAERALSAGNIIGILLFILDDEATWPQQLCDTHPTAVESLRRLKDRARQHTVTLFRESRDLPFLILRDTLAKIRSRLGGVPPRVRRADLPEERTLQRPIGMEFFTSADRRHFYGRNEKAEELLQAVRANVITLLLGNSGSGKTSLIHARLIPRATENGWLPVYTRPLGLPRSDVATLLSESVFEGPSSYRGSLVPLIEEAADAIRPRQLILIIDQFEDILTAREHDEAQRLVEDLRVLRYLSNPTVRVLVSYRADLEARLGQFWQLISGSPEGLSRVYIAGISASEAWRAVEHACDELRIALRLTNREARQITDDLISSSAKHGDKDIYPPYVQMLIDQMWQKNRERPDSYSFADYLAAGGMGGVTGGYLSRQLAYAQDRTGRIRAVLVSLVRSYGVKAQKSCNEIASDVGTSEGQCEVLLERLIDLRLVRHIGHQYEVAHDFLAHEISDKLVDTEERAFKRLRELLASKAAAFAATQGLLSVEELLFLFHHKERVLPSDTEMKLIFASWAAGGIPGLYWIMNAPAPRIMDLIRAEERIADLEDEDRAMLALLRRKLSNTPLRARDWLLFRKYKLGIELTGLLRHQALQCPRSVMLFALRSRHGNVRTAAIEALAKKVASGQRKWISELGQSSSPLKRTPYELLSLRTDLTLPSSALSRSAPRPLQEFALLQKVARAQGAGETRAAFRALKRFRPRARSLLFARGILMRRTGGLQSVLRRLPRVGGTKTAVLLSSAGKDLTEPEFQALLDTYVFWNQREAAHMDVQSTRVRAFYEEKATALAVTILSAATGRSLAPLRRTFESITLTPSAQYCALALLNVGKVRDVLRIIRKVEREPKEVRYWFNLGVAQATEKRMKELGAGVPEMLLRVIAKRAFWEDPRDRRLRFRAQDLLPAQVENNRALYVRLIAHAAIGAGQLEDSDLLKRLAQHQFRLIARAAAIRLAQVAGEEGIRILQSVIPEAIEQGGNAESLGIAIRDAEIQTLGVAELW